MPSEEEAIRDLATMEGRRRGPAGTGRVTVVYYLCRHGRHLEHPHLMELTLASPNRGLYLRDVMRRLDALRGKGMAAMYSWSCKRRYKTGFVWHDVCADDVLLPAHGGGEYVLKGSLLPLRHSPTPADQEQQRSVDATVLPKVRCVEPISEEESPAPSRGSQQAGSMRKPNQSSSSLSPHAKQPEQVSSSALPSSSSSTTKDSDRESAHSSSSDSSSSSSPNKPPKGGSGGSTPSSSAGSGSSPPPPPPPSLTPSDKEHKSVQSSTVQETGGVPLPPVRQLHRTKDASGGGRSGTLQSLIRAEAQFRRGGGCGDTSKRILLESDDESSSLVSDGEGMHSLGARLKPANLLTRLVACGSAMRSDSQHSACGFMRATTHKLQYSSHHLEPPPPSPALSPLGALIMRRETTGTRAVSESGESGSCRILPQTVAKGGEPGEGMPTSSCDPSSTTFSTSRSIGDPK